MDGKSERTWQAGQTSQGQEANKGQRSCGRGSLGSASGEGQSSGQKPIRLDHRFRQLEDPQPRRDSMVGGILVQSLEQVRERLREYDDCIAWYTSAKIKAQNQLDQLEKLIELYNQRPDITEEE